MNKALKIGFIGGGLNSAVGIAHFVASQMDYRFKVEAGCFSRNATINANTAERWGVSPKRVYDNATELLTKEKGQLDAVVVLTPTPYHLELVINAINAGFPVICEKALAISSKDAAKMLDAVQTHKGFLTVTYNYTGYPMVRELKKMLATGSLGRVGQVHIEMPQEGFMRLGRDNQFMTPQQWRLQDINVPMLSLDLGVHIHHLIDFLTGEKPRELVAIQGSLGNFRQVVDNTMILARYTNDMACNIWFSKAALGYRNGLRIRVFGELGSAEWYQMDPEFLTLHDNRGHKTIVDRASVDLQLAYTERYNRFKSGHPAGFLEAFANLYWDIADSLESFLYSGSYNSEYVFSAQHAWEGLVMLESVATSAQTHSWQSIII